MLQYWEERIRQASVGQDSLTPPELDPIDIPHLLPYI